MKKVLLFLSKGFEELEASVFIDVIGWSRECGIEPVGLITTALRQEVKGTWNLIVKPELDFENINIDDYDALAIPGGFERAGFYQDAFDERFLNLIRTFDKQNKIIAAICVGALPLGKSGVLTGRNATTYDYVAGERREQLSGFGVCVHDKRIEE